MARAVYDRVPIGTHLGSCPEQLPRLEGKHARIIEVRSHGVQQRLLVGKGQEPLEGVAGQEDQPEPLTQAKCARITFDSPYGEAARFAPRLL